MYNYIHVNPYPLVNSVESIFPILFILLGQKKYAGICILVYEPCLNCFKTYSIFHLMLHFYISTCIYHMFINHTDQT